MLLPCSGGDRCQGLYRGTVLQHLQHGRLKVFVHGVYPERCADDPDSLPVCEQLAPLWAGSNNGNGCFSYPNIGATVWVQFANDDVNCPVAVGATLGGHNAFHQYEQVKRQDEAVSEKHMFTAGMAHLQMHESGKLSAYVQQPWDNAASVDFRESVESCGVSADIERGIASGELSHIICQQVLDNRLDDGEISTQTLKHVPWHSSVNEWLSATNELVMSSDDGFTKHTSTRIRNNLGQTDDTMLCSTCSSQQLQWTDLASGSTMAGQIDASSQQMNQVCRRTDGSRKQLIQDLAAEKSHVSSYDSMSQELHAESLDARIESTNEDVDQLSAERKVRLASQIDSKRSTSYANQATKQISSLIADKHLLSASEDTTLASGKHQRALLLKRSVNEQLMDSNPAAGSVQMRVSNGLSSSRALDMSDAALRSRQHALEEEADTHEDEAKAAPGEAFIKSTAIKSKRTSSDDANLSSFQHSAALDIDASETVLDSVAMSLLESSVKESTSAVQSMDCGLKCSQVASTKRTETDATTDMRTQARTSLTADFDLRNTLLLDGDGHLEMSHYEAGSRTSETASPGAHSLYETQLTSSNGLVVDSTNLSSRSFNSMVSAVLADGVEVLHAERVTALETEAGVKTASAQRNLRQTGSPLAAAVDKSSRFEVCTDDFETSAILCIEDKVLGMKCGLQMDAGEGVVNLSAASSSFQSACSATVTLDTASQQVIVHLDGSYPCKITLDSLDGRITVNADNLDLIAANEATVNSDNRLTLKSSAIVIDADDIQLKSAGGINMTASGVAMAADQVAMTGVAMAKDFIASNNVIAGGDMTASGQIVSSMDEQDNDDDD